MDHRDTSKSSEVGSNDIVRLPKASVDQLRRIDKVCSQFEQDWNSNPTFPIIEPFLESTSPEDYPHLLESLIRSQRELEELSGKVSQLGEFLERFPTHQGVVLRAFLPTEEVDHLDGWSTMDSQSLASAHSLGAPSHAPEKLGHFEIQQEVARGGMGIVYRARHLELDRIVALKIIRAGQWANASEVARFRQEAMAAASLQHESIVPVYEVGSDQGFHFYSMPLIEGEDLSTQIARGPLEAKSIARIVGDVALAVQYAHEQGIVHRDLKPRNILIDTHGKVHVLDFGLATFIDRVQASSAEITKSGELIGTPTYMAPEQVQGKADRLSDLYGLGAILYAGLCARPPHQASTVVETIRQILDREPAAPRSMNPLIPKDLETICLKALQKEPGRRYSSALRLAEDLQRFLKGDPVLARPISTVERTIRWSRRNPGWSAAMASMIVLFAVASQLTWRNIEQTRASLEELRTEQAKTVEEQRRTLVEQAKTTEALAVARKSLYQANVAHANNAWSSLRMLNMTEPLNQCPTELRHWEWSYLQCQSDRRYAWWQEESSPVMAIAVAPQSQWIASANENGDVTIRDLLNNKEILKRESKNSISVKLAFVNRKLVYVERDRSGAHIGSVDAEIGVLNMESPDTNHFSWKAPKGFGISDLAVCSSAGRFAVAVVNFARPKLPGRVTIFDASVDPPVELRTHEMPSAGCRFIAYSPNGDAIAIAGGDRLVYLLDPEKFEVTDTFEAFAEQPKNVDTGLTNIFWLGKRYDFLEWGIDRIVFSPDGKLIAGGMHNGQLRIWNRETKKLDHVLQCGNDHIHHMVFSGDGRNLAVTPPRSLVVHIYDLAAGRESAIHQGHVERITGLLYLENHDLVTSSYDRTLRVWKTSDRSSNEILVGHSRSVLGSAFHPDGKILATGDGNMFSVSSPGSLRFWDIGSRTSFRQLEITSGVGPMQYNSTGSRLAVACGDAAVRIFNQHDDVPQLLQGHSYPVGSLAWHPSRNDLVSVSGSLAFAFLPGEATIWDTQSMTKRLDLIGHKAALSSVAYSPDGRTLATGSADKTVRIWDAESGECLKTLTGPAAPVLTLVFDPFGRWIAAGSGDILNAISPSSGEIHLWDTATGELVRVFRGHNQLVHGLAVTPDGQRLASCARNDKIRIWDVSTGVEMLNLAPADYACSLRFSPNGKKLVVPNWSGVIDIFSADKFGDR